MRFELTAFGTLLWRVVKNLSPLLNASYQNTSIFCVDGRLVKLKIKTLNLKTLNRKMNKSIEKFATERLIF